MITTDHAATLAGTWAGFTVRLATTSDDLQAVVALRRRLRRHDAFYDPDGDALRDAVSYVWIAERDGDLVATGRAIPFATGAARSLEIDAPVADIGVDNSFMEIGGLVADPGRGLLAGQAIMRLATAWMAHNTACRRVFGFCRQPVTVFYRRLGFAVRPTPFVPTRSTVSGIPLFLIHRDLAAPV
ncbi:GNAT family N-acetyltransferase [Micromonospora sp. BRA006-A]|uniref:GNAT family N-acetyltransferase n=1 Tax=Micromonospora sp. BRA006-A TaxID=2962860 RepID=UPI00296EFFA1|nr:GNAT family N-acetyltransferase [Micromonospora sp. BRA006-A]MDW3845661.1 GNAT family N-acetyltransferase [Micromonospora sp. BRA006-A]